MKPEAIVIPDDLLQRAGNGDTTALDELWTRCVPILQVALRRTRARPGTLDLADLAQQAALLLLERVREPDRPDGTTFAAAYARALRSSLSTYLRAERRRLGRQLAADEADLDRASRLRASGHVPPGVPGRRLARAVEQLSPRQRAIVAGLYDRELTVARLAAELRVTPQAITALHRRALACLRKSLAEEDSSNWWSAPVISRD